MNSKDSTHVFLEWTHRTNGQTTYLFKVFYPCLFLMNIQDKRTNIILIKAFYPGVFLIDTQDILTNNIFIQSILPLSFWNGYTGQMVKQHIYSKYSTHDFFYWTHRTNRQTTYLFKAFYQGVFIMDTQDKWSNIIFPQRILLMSF